MNTATRALMVADIDETVGETAVGGDLEGDGGNDLAGADEESANHSESEGAW